MRRRTRRLLCLFALVALALAAGSRPVAAKRASGTNLLFPFVSNQAGFDTIITIADTTFDTFGGTTGLDGDCMLHFFGDNAPPPVNQRFIQAGSTFTTLASTLAPGFQGYLIAQCQFPLAHGFAAVTDLGARNLAAGYPALVIPPGKRKKNERLEN